MLLTYLPKITTKMKLDMYKKKIVLRRIRKRKDCFCFLEQSTKLGHNVIRDSATVEYMQEAKRRRIRHETEPLVIKKTVYAVGNTVGIKIHTVARSNMDSNIPPCKILDIKIINDSKSV